MSNDLRASEMAQMLKREYRFSDVMVLHVDVSSSCETTNQEMSLPTTRGMCVFEFATSSATFLIGPIQLRLGHLCVFVDLVMYRDHVTSIGG